MNREDLERFTQRLTPVSKDAIIACCNNAAEEAQKTTDNIKRAADKLYALRKGGTDKQFTSCVYTSYIRGISGINRIYNKFGRIFGAVYDMYTLRDAILTSEAELETSIMVGADADVLYIKLPHIAVKPIKTASFLWEPLRLKLIDLDIRKKIPHIPDKHISILHIFDSTFNKAMMPDNDNYNIKRPVDLVCDMLGSSDGALYCSFYLDTVVSDNLPEGTYIIAGAKNAKLCNPEYLLEVIEHAQFS